MNQKKRRVDESAKAVMDTYLACYDLNQFAKDVSYYSAWYGRFGATNRLKFLGALGKEMEERL
jgi:hypothetical protein